ncbi:MAG TPA: sugar ABC transporter ATP-binding protein [Roseiflexaceae bacterium]
MARESDSGEVPLIAMRGISKRFGGIQALENVDFTLRRGEVMALVGENGAGKSTLIKILAGVYQGDSGQILMDGRPVEIRSPGDAQRLGVAVIYQEFNLTPNQTVAENVFLHAPQRRQGPLGWLGIIDQRTRAAATLELMRQVGGTIDPNRRVADLSVAQQQLTEIAKALAQDAQIIVMDEPTSALPEEEVGRLFEIIALLQERGIAVVFVSHRLDEVRRIADRVTVLRDGHKVGEVEVAQASDERLISMMVGRVVEKLFPKTAAQQGDVVLSVRGLSRKGALQDVSFDLRRGEILGFAGLIGAGRTETARCIFGADRIDSGTIFFDGQPVTISSPQDAVALGIGYVPEDRKLQGLILQMAVRENMTLTVLHQIARRGFVNWSAVTDTARQYVESLQLRPPRLDLPVVQLSGGNQQKVVVAKWLALKPKVLILDEPTRGIDVGAKAEIHALMDQLAHEGIGIILISSELPEMLNMSDRIVVMAEGEIVGELSREDATQERVLELASSKVHRTIEAARQELGETA